MSEINRPRIIELIKRVEQLLPFAIDKFVPQHYDCALTTHHNLYVTQCPDRTWGVLVKVDPVTANTASISNRYHVETRSLLDDVSILREPTWRDPWSVPGKVVDTGIRVHVVHEGHHVFRVNYVEYDYSTICPTDTVQSTVMEVHYRAVADLDSQVGYTGALSASTLSDLRAHNTTGMIAITAKDLVRRIDWPHEFYYSTTVTPMAEMGLSDRTQNALVMRTRHTPDPSSPFTPKQFFNSLQVQTKKAAEAAKLSVLMTRMFVEAATIVASGVIDASIEGCEVFYGTRDSAGMVISLQTMRVKLELLPRPEVEIAPLERDVFRERVNHLPEIGSVFWRRFMRSATASYGSTNIKQTADGRRVVLDLYAARSVLVVSVENYIGF